MLTLSQNVIDWFIFSIFNIEKVLPWWEYSFVLQETFTGSGFKIFLKPEKHGSYSHLLSYTAFEDGTAVYHPIQRDDNYPGDELILHWMNTSMVEILDKVSRDRLRIESDSRLATLIEEYDYKARYKNTSRPADKPQESGTTNRRFHVYQSRRKVAAQLERLAKNSEVSRLEMSVSAACVFVSISLSNGDVWEADLPDDGMLLGDALEDILDRL